MHGENPKLRIRYVIRNETHSFLYPLWLHISAYGTFYYKTTIFMSHRHHWLLQKYSQKKKKELSSTWYISDICWERLVNLISSIPRLWKARMLSAAALRYVIMYWRARRQAEEFENYIVSNLSPNDTQGHRTVSSVSRSVNRTLRIFQNRTSCDYDMRWK